MKPDTTSDTTPSAIATRRAKLQQEFESTAGPYEAAKKAAATAVEYAATLKRRLAEANGLALQYNGELSALEAAAHANVLAAPKGEIDVRLLRKVSAARADRLEVGRLIERLVYEILPQAERAAKSAEADEASAESTRWGARASMAAFERDLGLIHVAATDGSTSIKLVGGVTDALERRAAEALTRALTIRERLKKETVKT
jgi:hypothetical protein